ncbi:MAG: Ig-like domain-containing protein [Arhodomonas sp.]|nr:Ig-like domain-containing protein [Arhodomonas sp.]
MTAVAKDQNNRVVEGAEVDFRSDSGDLLVAQAVTNAAGQATASLGPGDNPRNRTITVTARMEGASDSVEIEVTGTTISLSGPSSVPIGATAAFTATLVDSAGNGIANSTVDVTSAQSNSDQRSDPVD